MNHLKTFILLAALTALFAGLGYLIGGATIGRLQQGATGDLAQRSLGRGVRHIGVESRLGRRRGGMFGHRAAPLRAGLPGIK